MEQGLLFYRNCLRIVELVLCLVVSLNYLTAAVLL